MIEEEKNLLNKSLKDLDVETLYMLKSKGFSDSRIAFLVNEDENKVRNLRKSLNILPVFKRVDTCAAEFESSTAYMYSTYEEECEARPNDSKKIMVLGGGPNRIGPVSYTHLTLPTKA